MTEQDELQPLPPPEVFSTGAARRYAVFGEFASGGIARVHLGRLLGPSGFARTVAIKRLRPQYAGDADFLAMFLDEARLTARIRHPNVVSTLDVLSIEGELAVVMEYVEGESLAVLLRTLRGRDERMPLPIAAAVVAGVLHGLHAAHELRDARGDLLNVIHRDVSPHNILVGTDGAPQLIDFGVAQARGRAQITHVGEIKGKLGYMPPEQLLNQPLDRRADVFAASVVLWEALAGRRLFQQTDEGTPFARFFSERQVDPPSLHAPGLPEEVDRVLLKGLSRSAEDRYTTAREMALALEAAATLATPSQIGAWVASLASDTLADRSRLVAQVENRVENHDVPAEAPRPSQVFRASASTRPDEALTPEAPPEVSSVALAVYRPLPEPPSFASKPVIPIQRWPRRAFAFAVVAGLVALVVVGLRHARWETAPRPAASAASAPSVVAEPALEARASERPPPETPSPIDASPRARPPTETATAEPRAPRALPSRPRKSPKGGDRDQVL